MIKVAILCVSTRCARGEKEDASSPRLRELVEEQGWGVVESALLPDEKNRVEEWLLRACDELKADLILTTGGTGLWKRDVTPEATLAVSQRLVPGIPEAMRLLTLEKTPHAILSRSVAGIRGQSLIVNLPGSPTGVVECFEVIKEALPHAIEVLQGKFKSHEPPTRR